MDIGDADNVDTPISARQVGCSVSFRPIAVTAAGMIRIHGPVRARCPGSHRPPVSGGVGNEGAGDPPGLLYLILFSRHLLLLLLVSLPDQLRKY